MRYFLIILFLFFCHKYGLGQNITITSGTPTYKSVVNTAALTGTNGFFNPINTNTFSRFQFIYSVAELNGFNVPFIAGSVIDTLWLAYKAIGLAGIPSAQLTNFAVNIAYSSTAPNAMSTNIGSNFIAGTMVNCLFAPNFNFITPNTTTWVGIKLSTPFTWNGTQNLCILLQYGTSTNLVNSILVESNPSSLQYNSVYGNQNGTSSALANSRPIIGISGRCKKPNKVVVPNVTLTCANNSTVSLSSSSTTPTAVPQWLGPSIVSGANSFTPNVNAPGIYSLILTNTINNCKDTGIVTVNSNLTIPNVSILPTDKLGCSTKSVSLNGSSTTAGTSAIWSGPGLIGANNDFTATANQLGSYLLIVTNTINGCKNTQTINVNQKTGVNNLSSISKNATCNTANGYVLIQTIGGGNGPYSINNGSSTITNITSLPIKFDNLLPRPYTLIVTDKDGCEYTATETVQSTSYPVEIITNTNKASCNGNADGSITITTIVGGVAPYTFTLNDKNIQTGTLPFTIQKLFPASYTLIGKDNNNCSIRSEVSTIGIYDLPKAYIEALPTITNIKESEVKFNGGSNSNIVKWEWEFNDQPKGFSNLQNPNYKFNTTGTHQVKLIITDQLGCQDTVTKEIIIEHVFKFFAATGFTPNDDIYNEKWLPKGIGIDKANYVLTVFNRWGQIIFQSNDFDLGWDGKVDGIKLPDGEFRWQVELKDLNGKRHQLSGLLILSQ